MTKGTTGTQEKFVDLHHAALDNTTLLNFKLQHRRGNLYLNGRELEKWQIGAAVAAGIWAIGSLPVWSWMSGPESPQNGPCERVCPKYGKENQEKCMNVGRTVGIRVAQPTPCCQWTDNRCKPVWDCFCDVLGYLSKPGTVGSAGQQRPVSGQGQMLGRSLVQYSPDVISILAATLLGILACSGVILAMRHFSHGHSTASKAPLLE